MLAVIKSSLSLPIDLCNIIHCYAVPRSMMRYSEYSLVQYIHCGTTYECDGELIQYNSVNRYKLTNRLKLSYKVNIDMFTIVTGLVDLLIVASDYLHIYEILPGRRYKLVNSTSMYLFKEDRHQVTYRGDMKTFLYEACMHPDEMFAYENNLILSNKNIVHIYDFDAKYNLILMCKFYTIGHVVAAYMYIVSKDACTLYVYDLTGELLRSINVDTEDTSDFIIDEYNILTYENIDWYKIDLNDNALVAQVTEKPECIDIAYSDVDSDVDSDVYTVSETDLDADVDADIEANSAVDASEEF